MAVVLSTEQKYIQEPERPLVAGGQIMSRVKINVDYKAAMVEMIVAVSHWPC